MTLTVAHVDAEVRFSGGEVQVFLLMEGLRERGHRNVLFCRSGSRCEEECRRRDLEYRLVPMRNYLDWRGVGALRRGFLEVGADLVQTNSGRDTWLGGWGAYRAGLPAISTRRMDRRVKRGWRTRLIYRRLIQRVVAISPDVRDCLVAGGVPAGVTELIYESVDPEWIRARGEREAVRRALGVGSEQLLLLGVGALRERKGWDVLLEALARLDPAVLDPVAVRVAGAGPEQQALEDQATRLGLADRVRFLGHRDDVGDLLGACDVFVLPSRREGLGVASLEAMSAGCPVVASRVGGLGTAVVHDETGLLVPPGEPEPLAEALVRLFCDEQLRGRLGDGGRLRAATEFVPGRMVNAYLELYERLLAEQRTRG